MSISFERTLMSFSSLRPKSYQTFILRALCLLMGLGGIWMRLKDGAVLVSRSNLNSLFLKAEAESKASLNSFLRC